MNFRLTEEQEMIRQMTADFTANEVVPYAGEWDKNGTVPFETIAKMQDLGLMTIGIPAEYGGDGLDWLSKYIVCDGLLKVMPVLQHYAGLHPSGPDPIWVAANDERKNGGMAGCWKSNCACLTEPEAVLMLGLSCRLCQDSNELSFAMIQQFITNGELPKPGCYRYLDRD